MGANMLPVLVLLILATVIAGRAAASSVTSDTPAVLTTSGGALVEYNDTISLNSDLMSNEYFLDSMTHFVRERIPERVVHAKGTGAFGYFTVTNDISSICKAKLFSEVGKTTPVAVRFSPSFVSSGGSETKRESRGFAVKFYTEDGNFDILGFSVPIITVRDPLLFSSHIHTVRPSPGNHMVDLNTTWDFVTARPEGLHAFFLTFCDQGIPDGYRHMPGFSIHTYQVVDDQGVSHFMRFYFKPDAGLKYLTTKEAYAIGGADPDYATRDLYDAIENNNFPSWTVSVQILSMEDVQNAGFDVFDVTHVIPLDQYPLTEVGRLVLNRNPTNHFASIEQAAYNPGNLVPGILGAPDKLFQARRFVYKDAQIYRLGINFQNIEVNSPLQEAKHYARDGIAPVKNNGGDGPNYYPNSFNGPEPYVDKNRVELLKVYHDDSVTVNFKQMANFYENDIDEDERDRCVQNTVGSLSRAIQPLQERAVKLFYTIHPELGIRIEHALFFNSIVK